MGSTKKPREVYFPKPGVLPLGMRKAVSMEMPGHIASLALSALAKEELLAIMTAGARLAPERSRAL